METALRPTDRGLSSVEPEAWSDVIDAYQPDQATLLACLPANAAQAIFGLADQAAGSDAAMERIARLEAAASTLKQK